MSTFLVIEEPAIVPTGPCFLCRDRATRLYTLDDGSTLLVCSTKCLLDAMTSTDGKRADGVMTPGQVEASIARRAQEEAQKRDEAKRNTQDAGAETLRKGEEA